MAAFVAILNFEKAWWLGSPPNDGNDAAFVPRKRMVRGQGPHGHALLLHCGRADLVGSPRSTQPGTGPRSCGGSSSTRAPATAAAAAPYTVVLSSNAATEPYLSWSALLALGCPHRPHLHAFGSADWRPIWAANLLNADSRLFLVFHKKRLSSR